GLGQTLGKPQPHHDGGEDHQERKAQIDHRVIHQDVAALALDPLVELHGVARLVQQAQHGALYGVRDIKERVEEVRQEHESADLVARRIGDQHDLAPARRRELFIGWRDEVEEIAEFATGNDLLFQIEDVGAGQ